MGILSRLFGKKGPERQEAPQHAVVVHFQYGRTDLQPIFALEDRLQAAINAAGTGEFDGNDLAEDGSDGYLYMYGPDADALFGTIRPILEASDFMSGASVRLRYGPPEVGVKETEKRIGS